MKDYRLTVTIRNNLLLRRIEASPRYESIVGFCRRHGLNYTRVAGLITMRISPLTSRGEWREIVERLASILKADPTELFPARQISGDIVTTTVEREVGEPELLALSEPEALSLIDDRTPEKVLADKQLLAELMADLPERERRIIAGYFGLDGDPSRTLRDLGRDFGIGAERCRNVILKAQTRMRSIAYRRLHLMTGERFHELERSPYWHSIGEP